jgi:hypothetical protein
MSRPTILGNETSIFGPSGFLIFTGCLKRLFPVFLSWKTKNAARFQFRLPLVSGFHTIGGERETKAALE